jgi:hypothetical protein
MMLKLMKSQVWAIYHRGAEHLPIDGQRALSLALFEAAERLQADIERRGLSSLPKGSATIFSPEVA